MDDLKLSPAKKIKVARAKPVSDETVKALDKAVKVYQPLLKRLATR